MIVTVNGERIECDKAIKGENFIELYMGGAKIASFEGISDFSGYSIEGGEWETPLPSQQERLEALEMAMLEMVLGGAE